MCEGHDFLVVPVGACCRPNHQRALGDLEAACVLGKKVVFGTHQIYQDLRTVLGLW